MSKPGNKGGGNLLPFASNHSEEGPGRMRMVYKGGGYTGLAMLTSFFILGTAATSWKKKEKLLIKGHATHQPTRTAGQVIANGGIAAISGLTVLVFPYYEHLLQIMMAASLAATAADTLSSELPCWAPLGNVKDSCPTMP